MKTTTQLNDPLQQYVSGLELARPRAAFHTGAERSLEAPASVSDMVANSGEQAFIADKSLVSFVAGLSGQAREDVLNSVLLAQLAANGKADIGTDMKAWYNRFVEVLKQVGWVLEKEQKDTFKSKDSLFEVEAVIVDILSAAFGAPYLAVIKTTLAALKGLADKDSGRITAFEQNTVENEKGCLQVGAAAAENDAVSMQIGTFMIQSKSKMKRILFFKFNKDQTSMEYAACKATLNASVYAGIRNTVAERLAGFVAQSVTELPLKAG